MSPTAWLPLSDMQGDEGSVPECNLLVRAEMGLESTFEKCAFLTRPLDSAENQTDSFSKCLVSSEHSLHVWHCSGHQD